MNQDKNNPHNNTNTFIWIVAGKRGMGKTTLVKKLLNDLTKKESIIIFDYHHEFSQYEICQNLGFLTTYINNQNEKNSKIQAIFWPNDSDKLDMDKLFTIVCKIVYNQGNIVFIIEECDNYCNPYYINEYFRQIIEYGRHKGISLICVTRRLKNISRSLTAQATRIYTFRQTEKLDLKVIEFLGLPSDIVQTLPDYKFISLEL